MTALERVIETYQRGQGVAHQVDHPNSVRGLLTDQVAVSEALYDAYRATDRDVYLDLAQELMLFAMRALWNARVGAFVDRVVATDDVGLLRARQSRHLRSIAEPLTSSLGSAATESVLTSVSELGPH